MSVIWVNDFLVLKVNLGEIVNDLIRKNIPKGVDHHLYGKVNIYRKGKPSWNKGKQGVYSEETLQKNERS